MPSSQRWIRRQLYRNGQPLLPSARFAIHFEGRVQVRKATISLWAVALSITFAVPGSAWAQKIGMGGTMVNENMELPKCAAQIGTVALVESKKQDNPSGQLPPGMAALMNLTRAQQLYSTATADPIPCSR